MLAERKRRSREWDPRSMSASEVFETPDPEVAFQPYAAVRAPSGGGVSASGGAPEDTHAGYDKANMELDEGAVAPTQAFEVFMGKVYKPAPHLPERTELEALGGQRESPSRSSGVPRGELESPLQRFTRLAMEIKELEGDLGLLAAAQDAKRAHAGAAVVVVDAAQDAEYGEIMRGLATLQLNLSAMEQTDRFRPFLQPAAVQPDAVAAFQRDLTAKFFSQIDALKRAQQQQPSQQSAAASGAPIVYEIYSNGELNAVDRDAKTRLLALESRLAMLEQVIGATNPKELHVDGLRASTAASADLSSLVDELDKRVGLLNEKNLDAIKTRTTALVHEFTLLHKLKESPSVQSALATQADRDKIQQIYDKLNSVEDVAASVPALVDRLVTLKAVHDESLDTSTRVKKIEHSQTLLQDLLGSDESILANIEKSLQENVQIFQANIQTLDERMNHLLNGGR